MRFSSFNAMFFRYQKTYLYAGRYLTWQAVFQVLLCQIEIVWVFSGSIPVLMVLAGQWAWDCKSSFVRWAWALWTVNPNGVSGSIPLMNESETERKKMQVKRDENPRLGTCIWTFRNRYCKVFSDPRFCTKVLSLSSSGQDLVFSCRRHGFDPRKG